MKLHFPWLILPLVECLPPTWTSPQLSNVPYVFNVDSMSLTSWGYLPYNPSYGMIENFSYEISLRKYNDREENGALCTLSSKAPPTGQLQMRCTQKNPIIELNDQLNVRIQKPDNMKPLDSGFNVLINWK